MYTHALGSHDPPPLVLLLVLLELVLPLLEVVLLELVLPLLLEVVLLALPLLLEEDDDAEGAGLDAAEPQAATVVARATTR